MDQLDAQYEEEVAKLDTMMKEEVANIKEKYAELKKKLKKDYAQKKKQLEKPVDKTPRKTIPKTLKNQVWDQYIGKDKGIGLCECCKKEIDSKHFECGHIIAVAEGGDDTIDNLRPICGLCNKSMGKMNMTDFCDKYMKSVVKGPTFEELQKEHHTNTHKIADIDSKITSKELDKLLNPFSYERENDVYRNNNNFLQHYTITHNTINSHDEKEKLKTRNDEISEIMNKMYPDKAKEYIENIKNDIAKYHSLNLMRKAQVSFSCRYCN